MIKHTILFLICFLPLFGSAQTLQSVKLKGYVHAINDSTDFIENAEIVILKGTDTIQVLKTTNDGAFSWSQQFNYGEKIQLIAKHRFFSSYKYQFIVSKNPSTIDLKFALIPISFDVFNHPIFEANNTEQFTGFDLELLKHQLRGMDTFCMEFIHVTFTNESDEVAKKRMNYFKHYLEQYNVNLNHFSFSMNNLKNPCATDDCRGRIEGKVISLEENCK